MKAIQFDRTSDLANLRYVDVDPAPASSSEVRVRVVASALNPSDVKNVLGRFPYTTLPRIPGRDFAGIVEQGPPELIGRAVWGSGGELGFTRDGSHAEYLTLPVAAVAFKPAALSFEQAASCGVPYATAWEALERSATRAGTRVLILGAGAVARAAAALASTRQAKVLIAARRPQLLADFHCAACDTIALGSAQELQADLTQRFGSLADVIIDTTGAWLAPSIKLLASDGTVVVIAAPANGEVAVPVLDLYRRGGRIVGVNSLHYDSIRCGQLLTQLQPLFEAGALTPPGPLQIHPFSAALDAYRALDEGASVKFVFTL